MVLDINGEMVFSNIATKSFPMNFTSKENNSIHYPLHLTKNNSGTDNVSPNPSNLLILFKQYPTLDQSLALQKKPYSGTRHSKLTLMNQEEPS